MGTMVVNPPLSNIQAELLKLFSVNLPEEQLIELRKVIAKFLLEQARDKADQVWENKGYTKDSLDKLLLKGG